ncbi:MAG: DUF72 domain-containing protein [Verrucomicrobia bacterium]|nr:DUF72 domain-containing protein [Verrucomicrobiota bacterium]
MMFDERTHAKMHEPLAALASQGVFIGTSSWKYPGWLGQVYDDSRYLTRGKFSEAKFERECLVEYADTFPTVCVDAGYYKFPTDKYLYRLCADVPSSFRFGFKVTDTITIHHYSKLPRFGNLAGTDNKHFLDAELFVNAFLKPCEPYRGKIGVLIFEFSQFHASDFARGREFVSALDVFLSQLPKTWAYAVETRNESLLHPEYFAMLKSHGVAHVFNSWTRMPEVSAQIEMPGSFTTDFLVARFLLKPGRSYESAVNSFSPYTSTKEPYEAARAAGKALIQKARAEGKRPSFVFVNNRLEGNAPITIASLLEEMEVREKPQT